MASLFTTGNLLVALGTAAGFGGLIGGHLEVWHGLATAALVDDFKSSGGSHLVVTPMGRVLQTNPNDTVFGSTKVNDFASGPEGGLSINGGGDNAELINEIRRLTDARLRLKQM